MTYLIHVEEFREYEADAEALKAKYPDEYAQFVEAGGAGDREWIEDCWDNGGPRLFKQVNATVDVNITARAGKGSE